MFSVPVRDPPFFLGARVASEPACLGLRMPPGSIESPELHLLLLFLYASVSGQVDLMVVETKPGLLR